MVPSSLTRVSSVRLGFWNTLMRMLSPGPRRYSGSLSCARAPGAKAAARMRSAAPSSRCRAMVLISASVAEFAEVFYPGPPPEVLHLHGDRLARAPLEQELPDQRGGARLIERRGPGGGHADHHRAVAAGLDHLDFAFLHRLQPGQHLERDLLGGAHAAVHRV